MAPAILLLTIIIGGPEINHINALLKQAQSGGSAKWEAIAALVAIASGTPNLLPANATRLDLTGSYVRGQAFAALGKVREPVVTTYIETLTPGNLANFSVWNESRIALANHRLAAIATPEEQLRLLEATASDPAGYVVSLWAVEQLCDRGAGASVGLIRQTLETILRSDSERQPRLKFCLDRISLLSTHPDRDEALGSALFAPAAPDTRLLSWAVHQLHRSGSERAKAVLARFKAEVAAMPDPAQRYPFEELLHSLRP